MNENKPQQVPSYTSVGGYPLYYFDNHSSCWCPSCVNADPVEFHSGDWSIAPPVPHVNYENINLYCDECQRPIECAYPPVTEGSLISGTLRNQDLLVCFSAFYFVVEEHYKQHGLEPIDAVTLTELKKAKTEPEDSAFWDSDDAHYLIEVLFDALGRLAPAGLVFGAHPNDGADFGYWAFEAEGDN